MFWHGFYLAIIVIGFLFIVMFMSKKGAEKAISIFKIILIVWCTGIFTLTAAGFTLIYSAVAALTSSVLFGTFICAGLLVILWCLEERLYRVLTGEDAGSAEKLLTNVDKNTCNICALGGVMLSSVVLGVEQGNQEYITIISIAISIWIGAYIPITEIFDGKSIKAILGKIRTDICSRKKTVWIAAIVSALLVPLGASKKNIAQKAFSIIENLGIGIAVGSCAALGGIILFRIYMEKKAKPSKKENSTERKTIRVVAAIIRDGDKIFATQRGHGEFKGGWEFPGGKIEPGETPEEALVREVREELDTEIKVVELVETVEYDYPTFHLSMDCFWAEVVSGDLVLKEHEAAKWLTKDELGSVEWLPADVELIEALKDMM